MEVKLVWSYGNGNDWHTGEWQIAEGEVIFYRVKLCVGGDLDLYGGGKWHDCLHFSNSATSLRTEFCNITVFTIAGSSAAFDGISCLQRGKLLILTGVRWGEISIWGTSGESYKLEGDKVVEYKYKRAYPYLLPELPPKKVVATSRELLSEFISVAEYVYEYVLSKF